MKIVVLTGAGVSQESGIKTFRDSNGLWENHDIREVAHPDGWKNNRSSVNRFYNERRKQLHECHPNSAHYALAELDRRHDVTIITQNVDDLHERAGSKNVLHLHGELFKVRDEVTEDVYEWKCDLPEGALSEHGNPLRPHIVWFTELVPNIEIAQKITQEAELFMIIGTSLEVYPAAGLREYAPKTCPIHIFNMEENGWLDLENQHVGPAGLTVPEFVKDLVFK